MKKTVRIFVIIAMFFMATLMTGCSLDEYKEIDEKYTVRFVDEEGNIIKSITKLVGEQFLETEVPAFPEKVGRIGAWTIEGNEDFDYKAIQSNTIIQATYTYIKYEVVFKDYDGTTLETQMVEYSSGAVAPADPTRTGYTFTGWDKDFSYITDELEVTAQYNINKYEVVFKDHDGTELSKQEVEYLGAASAPADPTRTGYTFKGWDKAFDSITGDLEVVAQYEINKYTVVFKDHDGTELSKQEVEYLGAALAPADPTRTGYTFKGWDKAFDSITADLEVVAQYTINKYAVVFKDYDGTILSEQEAEYLSAALAPADPTRTGYTFTGWDKAFDAVSADIEVTAQYDINKFTVVFKDYDGTVLETQTVEYLSDALAPANPTRVGYAFTGWDKAFTAITADLEVTAQYAIRQYSITVQLPVVLETGEEGWVSQVLVVADYNTVHDLAEKLDRIVSNTPGFTFNGWKDNAGLLTTAQLANYTLPAEDVVLVPQATINSYNVTFVDSEGNVIAVVPTLYKHAAVAPTAPAVEGHTFAGWDKDISSIATDITVKALYDVNTYTVKFLDENGNLISTQEVTYKHAATAPTYSKVGYTYTWDKAFDSILGDLEVKVVLTPKTYTIKIYVGDNLFIYVETPEGEKLHYGDTFIPTFTVEGDVEFTGKLIVVASECSDTLSSEYYMNSYTIEDVEYVVFRAELTPKQ